MQKKKPASQPPSKQVKKDNWIHFGHVLSNKSGCEVHSSLLLFFGSVTDIHTYTQCKTKKMCSAYTMIYLFTEH